ncbi:hypothetical protein TCAL_11281 [Tigriopus californicus]|uniref:Fringe-like glycosyltransferase domain-containing protein n=1 Tax=Tigriopus californicus TaxID=6832 RepID=A0A553NUG9_TIGCA|nr:fringe glycosyltransferase-like [Tigriopus californicus]TRY69066.1 hypothetical protein TCAL_11281 [Tigriopus californicus]
MKKEPPTWSHLWTRYGSKSLVLQSVAVIAICVLLFCFLIIHKTTSDSSTSVHQHWNYRGNILEVTPNVARRFKISVPQTSAALAHLEDIFVSVKTSQKFHESRLDVILNTWFQLARDQIWFFTDAEDPEINRRAYGHLKVTNCPASHSRQALCCKMAAEFEAFLQTSKSWFCHFDDDNYVNIQALVSKLQEFDYREDWYLGKPSIPEPLKIPDRENMKDQLSFWFATGGAGFCLSRSLALKMRPVAGGGKFELVGDKIRLPDDVTMGYIAEHLLHTPLTVIEEFHSHLEPQRLIEKSLDSQISFSYSKYGNEMNTLVIEGFNDEEDPTRFKSLHCKLFPNFSWCPSKSS